MKLKTKSFLNVALLTIVTSIVIAYLTFENSEDILQNSINHEVKSDSKRVYNHLDEIKQRVKKSLEEINSSQDVVASLNLISNYEDKKDYDSLIFDAEKKSLLEYSKRFFQNDSFYLIEYYDNKQNLIAKKSFNESLASNGFVVYKDETAYFKSANKLSKLNPQNGLSKECKTKSNTDYQNGYYKLCNSKAIKFDKQLVGYAKITYYFGKEKLEKLQKDFNHPISFSVDKDNKNSSVDKTILDEELNLYIKHNVDFSYYDKKRKELISMIILVVILMTIIIFYIFISFINIEILKPLKKLQDALESMLNKKYKPIEIRNQDEIGEIFQASNTIFEKFWESYSSLESYKKSVETSNLVTKADLKGNITYANELFCKTSGYKLEEILGKPHNIIRHQDMSKKLFKDMWNTIKKGKTWRGLLKNSTKQGGYYWTDAVITPMYTADKSIEGYISIRRDITDLMKSKEEIEFRANYDLLTRLKSRTKLHLDIEKSVQPCLILINIDRFSQINDFYGHSFGDKLLQAFAKSLKSHLEKRCIYSFELYRNGADEFAILLKEYDKEKVVINLKNMLNKLEKTSLKIEDKELNLNLSCGISFESSQETILCADMALKISKKEKKDIVIYSKDNSLNKQYENNLLWANRLKKAIDENRVVPFFQPIVNNKTLKYEKYEALVRIVEPDTSKVISPFFFLDIAKQTKQYLKLTKIMIEKSFEMFYDKDFEFSINLTMEDISNSEIREFIFSKLDENVEVTKRLVLELVESESIKDYELVIDFIDEVKSKGCKIAIDDFGSGYSNFEYLIKLQADYIKIDGSLIKNINTQRESYVVVSTIVNFAKQMGIKTIGEFIENEEILKTSQSLGIDYSQGYHFSAPKDNI
ncbi:MAG: EAL domain-containing protein [Campylobacterota bacterium]